MDPFREPGGVPPPLPEPTPKSEPREPSGPELLRGYRRTMLGVAIIVWVAASLLLAPLSLFLSVAAIWQVDPGNITLAVLAELVHSGLYLIAPWVGWSAAKSEVAGAGRTARLGGWIICRPAPRWPLWALPVSWVISVALLYGGAGLLPRLAYVLAWLMWCDHASKQVAIARWTKNEEGERVLELETPDRPRQVRLERVDVETGEIEILDQGRRVPWSAISSLDKLAPKSVTPPRW